MVYEQLGLPNTFQSDCRTEDSGDSSNSDGEQKHDESSSPVNDVSGPLQEGMQKVECRLLLMGFVFPNYGNIYVSIMHVLILLLQ